ncbi:MAG: endoflagellar motor switch protein [Leptospiraceae bacterium]|nr:endoflagellar motor switch protein [Leptospiraceae bacterium]
MINTKNQTSKAAILYSLIGEHIPKSVLSALTQEELEKLFQKVTEMQKPSFGDEKSVLSKFADSFNRFRGSSNVAFQAKINREIEKLIQETANNKVSPLIELKKKNRSELSHIVKDENARTIALVMSFANPDEASSLIEDFPEKKREEIIYEIHKIDFHSETVRNELERFLNFKFELIKNNQTVSKVRNRGSKITAEILSRISPHVSFRLFSKIKKKNPLFAENINEHFYTMEDLQFASRSALTEFLATVHPIVIASSFKGIETEIKDKLLERVDPWLSKQVALEMDSMGPISLAEIEEAQTAIITLLNESVEKGTIKLWKVG